MLIKTRSGWDIRLADGEGCCNVQRHELEELMTDIQAELLNNDFDENGIPKRGYGNV
jgi:hypothetical protein